MPSPTRLAYTLTLLLVLVSLTTSSNRWASICAKRCQLGRAGALCHCSNTHFAGKRANQQTTSADTAPPVAKGQGFKSPLEAFQIWSTADGQLENYAKGYFADAGSERAFVRSGNPDLISENPDLSSTERLGGGVKELHTRKEGMDSPSFPNDIDYSGFAVPDGPRQAFTYVPGVFTSPPDMPKGPDNNLMDSNEISEKVFNAFFKKLREPLKPGGVVSASVQKPDEKRSNTEQPGLDDFRSKSGLSGSTDTELLPLLILTEVVEKARPLSQLKPQRHSLSPQGSTVGFGNNPPNSGAQGKSNNPDTNNSSNSSRNNASGYRSNSSMRTQQQQDKNQRIESANKESTRPFHRSSVQSSSFGRSMGQTDRSSLMRLQRLLDQAFS